MEILQYANIDFVKVYFRISLKMVTNLFHALTAIFGPMIKIKK